MIAARRVGLLGGTFDPVHNAHLDLAELFVARLALSELRFVPAGLPWQKGAVYATAPDRLAMLRLALEERALQAIIDEREMRRAGPSFTIDTVREVRAELGPEALIVLLVGADQLERLHTWHEWQALFDEVSLAVGGRPSFHLDMEGLDPSVAAEVTRRRIDEAALPGALTLPSGQVALLPADLGTTSSSAIRTAVADGHNDALADLLPSSVLEYIQGHRLYQH